VPIFPLDHAALAGLPSQAAQLGVAADWSTLLNPSFLGRNQRDLSRSCVLRDRQEPYVSVRSAREGREVDPGDLNRAHWISAVLARCRASARGMSQWLETWDASSIKRSLASVGFARVRNPDVDRPPDRFAWSSSRRTTHCTQRILEQRQ